MFTADKTSTPTTSATSSPWLSNDTCAGAQRHLPDPAAPLQHFHLASCRCYSESQVSKAKVCQHDSGSTEKCHGLCSRREKRQCARSVLASGKSGNYREIRRLTLARQARVEAAVSAEPKTSPQEEIRHSSGVGK